VSRHGGRPLYRASEADLLAWEWALRPKVCLLAIDEKLRTIVASILDWSPEQISKWLKVHYPSNESMRVSHGNCRHQKLRLRRVPNPQMLTLKNRSVWLMWPNLARVRFRLI
jgi:IS30 family transposase